MCIGKFAMYHKNYTFIFTIILTFMLHACAAQTQRLSRKPPGELASLNNSLPVSLCIGSTIDKRTHLNSEYEFKGWLSTNGNVPLSMEELRIQLVKNISNFNAFDRIMVLDQVNYSSLKEELEAAELKGADILVRSKLSSMEYSSNPNGWLVLGVAISIPFGLVCIAISAGTAIMVLVSGKELADYRWAAAGDLILPSVTGKIQPLLYLELYDVTTGEQISEASIEWLIEQDVTSPLFEVKPAWIARSRELSSHAYRPLAEDMAIVLSEDINSLMKPADYKE